MDLPTAGRSSARGGGEFFSTPSQPAENFALDVLDGRSSPMDGMENLYGVYQSFDQLDNGEFDSEEALVNVEADLVLSRAEKMLRFVVGNRRILLENEVNVLPTAFRLDLQTAADQGLRTSAAARETLDLVEALISKSVDEQRQEQVQDAERMLSDQYIDTFTREAELVCALAGELVDAVRVRR
jgi:hypothetical protein